ncbi:MAG: hypothetical protein KGZ88_03785 [Methylomicrobium sp.]|nr:hypothetical protein [Methylomicrobium sp.]
MFRYQTITLLFLASLALSGCGPMYYSDEVDDDDLVEVSYDAVEDLIKNLRQPLPRGSLVVINSLVNTDDLGQTLSFGRIISEQISSALHRSGYQIMGMELPTEIFVKNDSGILHLSDTTKADLNKVGASALIIGVFAPGKENAYISLRAVDIETGHFISTSDLSVAMGPDVKNMLKAKKIEKVEKEADKAVEAEPAKADSDESKSEFEPLE